MATKPSFGRKFPAAAYSRSKENCSHPCQVVVFSEDAPTHQAAVAAWGELLVRFEQELSFAFSYWDLTELNDPTLANWVREDMARADILVFSLRGRGLSPGTMSCLESCIAARTKTEGALALMVTHPADGHSSLGTLWLQTQYLANRLRMDFLPLVPAPASMTVGTPPPSSPELLDFGQIDVGHDHWGLNE